MVTPTASISSPRSTTHAIWASSNAGLSGTWIHVMPSTEVQAAAR